MKSTSVSYALLALVAVSVNGAEQPGQAHPCVAYPNVSKKLASCSTAESFCSSLITPTFTRTVVKTVTAASSTSTDTVYGSTVTEYTATVLSTATATTSTDTTITPTTIAPTCTVNTGTKRELSNGRFDIRKRAGNPAASCGISNNTPQSAVSGGCQCKLAKVTTSTSTVTSGSTTVTASVAGPTTYAVYITYTTTTSTAYTSTATAQTTQCVTSCNEFSLKMSAPGSQYDGQFLNVNAQASTGTFTTVDRFSLDTAANLTPFGSKEVLNKKDQNSSSFAFAIGDMTFFGSSSDPLTCSFGVSGLRCTNIGGCSQSDLDSNGVLRYDQSGSVPSGNSLVTLVGYCLDNIS